MKDAILRFVKGTNNVTKFAVLRHLNWEVHKNKPPEDRLNLPSLTFICDKQNCQALIFLSNKV